MHNYQKILVVCPSNMVTGGPEALHQLVRHMIDMGLPAFIVYLPFEVSAETPLAYKKYQVPVAQYEDKPGNLIIFPEIYPMLALKVKHAKAGLWWLSLDNFLERKNVSRLRDNYHYFRAVIRRMKPLRGAKSLKKLIHFSQTHHSSQYLLSCGITPVPLIDSINEVFLNDDYRTHQHDKKNIILFNATKGKKVTQQLIAQFPEYDFMPLAGYSAEALSRILYSAKLYIDFGHHPGRDRMPREAAMHGCCVISGTLGSAGNMVDLPIPTQYKLNVDETDFLWKFKALADDIFSHFNLHFDKFEAYRTYLKGEPAIFKQQIADYFLAK